MTLEDLPPGWQIWNEETTRIVLAYRPDVFDTQSFPAPCMPTLYLTKGRRGRRPGRDRPDPDDDWFVTLYLEPDVDAGSERYDSREAALDRAVAVAREFVDGEVDYRDLYQVPRPEYFDELDDLTG